eukprot:31635_1
MCVCSCRCVVSVLVCVCAVQVCVLVRGVERESEQLPSPPPESGPVVALTPKIHEASPDPQQSASATWASGGRQLAPPKGSTRTPRRGGHDQPASHGDRRSLRLTEGTRKTTSKHPTPPAPSIGTPLPRRKLSGSHHLSVQPPP